MLAPLIHAHKGLAYLVFALALIGLVLGLAGAGGDRGRAAMLDRVHRIGLLNVGRLNLVLGIALAFMVHAEGRLSLWLGLLLWAPIEIVGKRMVTAPLRQAMAGEHRANPVRIGTLIQFVVIAAIYGLMTLSRMGKLGF